jgi:hypothetical protein
MYNIIVQPNKENSQPLEISPALLEAYTNTFFNRRDTYALQLDSGEYVRVKYPLTLKHLHSHFMGKLTLGTYALDNENRARWLCLDADDADRFDLLTQMAQQLQTETIPAYLETSRRGGHLWLFTPPLPGTDMRRFGQALLQRHHIPLKALELYPKQDTLKLGVGSQVRLPLGVHRKSGKRYSFITLEGQPLAPSIRHQIALLATPNLVPNLYIEHLLKTTRPKKLAAPRKLLKRRPANGNTLSERLKSTVSVLEFVGQYVALDGNGRGFCPFHEDEHPSFQVNAAENYWSCYAGCGGGSIIDFWMKWRVSHDQDGSFKASLKDLADRLLPE